MAAQQTTDGGETLGARELFEDAARASRRVLEITAELDAIEEGWRCGEWLAVGNTGWYGDPTSGKASYCMARTSALEAELANARASVDEATALTKGVAVLLGSEYADAVRHRYIEGKPWAEVAALLGRSERTAYNRVSTALDLIDSMGVAKVREGRGMAV